jgi:excisionase family DNA binding protein
VTRDELILLTKAELAELWRVSVRTIERRIKAGEIPTVTVAGQPRIRAIDAALLADNSTNVYQLTSTRRKGSR